MGVGDVVAAIVVGVVAETEVLVCVDEVLDKVALVDCVVDEAEVVLAVLLAEVDEEVGVVLLDVVVGVEADDDVVVGGVVAGVEVLLVDVAAGLVVTGELDISET